MTQRQLKRLEEQGVLVSRRLGNMRLFSFNERHPTVRNLRKLLAVELATLPEGDQQQYFRDLSYEPGEMKRLSTYFAWIAMND